MKVGLFFGSFNPIHQGHMILANYMLAYAPLDEVWFIVSPQNPLKDKSGLLHEFDRFNLLEMAIGSYPYFKVSDIEFFMPRPSYTIDTLVRLSEQFPSKEFFLICGTDTLQSLHKWKNYEQILKYYHFLVYPRKGSDGGELMKHPHVQPIEAPEIELSSSFIRKALKGKKDIRFMLPPAVYEEIIAKGYYNS